MATGSSELPSGSKSQSTRSFDAYIPIQETSQHVHLQILQGDIEKENTDVLVIFRSDKGTVDGESLRLLQAAGDAVEAEYQNVKALGGKYVAKGVVLTRAGNLEHPRHILHLPWNKNIAKFRASLALALRLVEKQTLQLITFPHLPDAVSSTHTMHVMMESFEEFTMRYRPICLHFIQVVSASNQRYYQYADAKQRGEFEMYKHLLLNRETVMGPMMMASIPLHHETKDGKVHRTKRTRRIITRKSSHISHEDSDNLCQSVHPQSVQITSYRKIYLEPHFWIPTNGIHAKLGQVYLHLNSINNDNYSCCDSQIAFVDFQCATPVCDDRNTPLYAKRFLSISADHLADDITIKTKGNQCLYEINIDDEPGKFPRIRSAIHRVLNDAAEKCISCIVFPSWFEYGSDQILTTLNINLKPDEHKCQSHIIPLLYFHAMYNFALYNETSTQHDIHIHINCQNDLCTYKEVWHQCFPFTKGMRNTCFAFLFTKLVIDPLSLACHLSAVKETYKIIRYTRRESSFGDGFHPDKCTTVERFTYGRALQQIAPIKIPQGLMLRSIR